jgi:hypothetical protein
MMKNSTDMETLTNFVTAVSYFWIAALLVFFGFHSKVNTTVCLIYFADSFNFCKRH